jgi:pimeloyl-ACP methyl ester carboxylesterase
MSIDDYFAAYDAMLARWPVSVKTLDVSTGYGTTRINVCGPEDAPPLILLHGGRTSSPYWYANVGALGAGRRVYALDTMGDPGRSTNDGRPIRGREDLMAWLDEVLHAIGVGKGIGGGIGEGVGLGAGAERVDLCGHSFGAWLALAFSVRTPGRVRRLALLDPTQCFAGFRFSCLWRAALSALPGRSPAGYYAWEAGGAPLDPGWLALQDLARGFPTAKLVAGKQPSAQQLSGLTLPVLVLLAQDSRVHDVAKVGAAARRTLPDATVATMPGVSHHMLPFTGADELNRRLIDFLS